MDYPNSGRGEQLKRNDKDCRTCTDFKRWMRIKKNDNISSQNAAKEDCPLDKEELGRNTWSFLHTMAANFPKKPSDQQQSDMKSFIKLFSTVYPCSICAEDFANLISENPPITSSQEALAQWFCRAHNAVNAKLGKSQFDCTLVNERWKDGWKDGSCEPK